MNNYHSFTLKSRELGTMMSRINTKTFFHSWFPADKHPLMDFCCVENHVSRESKRRVGILFIVLFTIIQHCFSFYITAAFISRKFLHFRKWAPYKTELDYHAYECQSESWESCESTTVKILQSAHLFSPKVKARRAEIFA